MIIPLGFLPTGSEWIWIVLVIILLFGARRLPELARGLGKSLGEFRKAKAEFDREVTDAIRSEPNEKEQLPSTQSKDS
ncbi:MAG: twin-arginine translocase TatA/TatE family subunit [Candidatus Methylacidiphilales bacterium]